LLFDRALADYGRVGVSIVHFQLHGVINPCGHPLSPVIARRSIIRGHGGDGLADDRSGRLVFVNPPFSALLTWLRRAFIAEIGGAAQKNGRPQQGERPFFHLVQIKNWSELERPALTT
jgi:hypothetical protein